MTAITLRIPEDVVDSLKTIAPHKGFTGYQALLKAYISEGLRRDEAVHLYGPARMRPDPRTCDSEILAADGRIGLTNS